MSLWEDYRDEALASQGRRGRSRSDMGIRISRPFTIAYEGQFCILCGSSLIEGDEGCFYGDEIAHHDCATEDQSRSTYIPQFEFDPRKWNL